MNLSNEMKEVALQLLLEFGETATFTRTVESTYNSQTGEAIDGSTTTFTAFVAPQAPQKKEKADGEIQTNDVQLLMMHETEVPIIGDVVTYNNINYRIFNIENARVSGTTILYTLSVQQ